MRITVLSTFDVWPPRDGGQTRYVNLWRNFSSEHEITILAYEFRNRLAERRFRLDDHVEVIVPAASYGDAHHFHYMMEQTGLWLHDILCLSDYNFSPSFMRRLGTQLRGCDLLVASHPYLAKLAFPLASAGTGLVYESHNVELDIKTDYFRTCRDKTIARRLLEDVRQGEGYAARHADLVSAVSRDDGTRLAALYGLDPDAMTIVPNGANIRAQDLLRPDERREVLRTLGLEDRTVGIFLGSAFAANVESYRRGREVLDAAGFRGTMLLVGSIDQAPRDAWGPVNFTELWLGFVDAQVRDVLLSAADFAFHLMFSGAGTNLKLFDYMGAGIPVIANAFGRRGVRQSGWCLEAETPAELARALARLREEKAAVAAIAATARRIALEDFDWRRIAEAFERAIVARMPWLSPQGTLRSDGSGAPRRSFASEGAGRRRQVVPSLAVQENP